MARILFTPLIVVAGVMQMERRLMEFLLKNSIINPRIMVKLLLNLMKVVACPTL
jgi:hypothetical protein